MTIAYIYRWTQKSTGKWYLGARGMKGCHPDDGNICSSKLVKPLIISNPDDWVREILYTGPPENIFDIEAQMLTSLNAKEDPMSFNKHNGDGSFSMRGKQFNIEHRKKMGEWQIGRVFDNSSIVKRTISRKNFHQPPEAKEKISKKLKGLRLGISPSEETRKKLSQSLSGRKLKPLSEKHKALISSAKTGQKHKPESIQKMRDKHSGKVLSEDHKLKISLGGKGIKKSDETRQRMRKPKVKKPCPFCELLCAPHMFQRHIDARHSSN